MPNISISDIKKAADEKYGPYIITGIPGGPVELMTIATMDKATRMKLLKIEQEQYDVEQTGQIQDPFDQAAEQILLVAKTPEQGKRLIDQCEDNLGYLMEILSDYRKANQLGEVLGSVSS